ncbi:hypothetical protein ACFP3Q_14200 [Nocardioides sp. GCM10027113]|uniref:hypothetical protein n=1 Tax=unclassified Nocardioides TaxID=2615069 RepID=UPI0036107530
MADERDERLDAPAPPGGPQRADAPDGPVTPGEPAPDPGPEVQRVTRREEGEAHEPGPGEEGQSQVEAALQAENAETSLDQPSQ